MPAVDGDRVEDWAALMTCIKAYVKQGRRNGRTGWVTTVEGPGARFRCAWFEKWHNAMYLAVLATREPVHWALDLIQWERPANEHRDADG